MASAAESGWWRDYLLATDGREGHPVRVGALAEPPDEWLGAIAHGCGAALAPASNARCHARPAVTHRLVIGVGPSRGARARAPADDRDPVVQDSVRRSQENGGAEGSNTTG
ncbi:hypothetical protein [Streptomyces sp. TLI_146]|uniref:hypothetical protein n=1 Tax=Streptomyces sp. TLI_146 TaxID=1938858 RepID=UPI000C7066B7|nr:hypothetical protein [Streptomyces sp. TLI_146]